MIFDQLTESPTIRLRSGNPITLLPPRQRLVFLGKAFGVQMAELARLLGLSRETVHKDLRVAWAALTRLPDRDTPTAAARQRQRGAPRLEATRGGTAPTPTDRGPCPWCGGAQVREGGVCPACGTAIPEGARTPGPGRVARYDSSEPVEVEEA